MADAENAEASSVNWSERVEDLIESGEIDAAISLLETLTTDLHLSDSRSSSSSSAALFELSKLYAAKGLSLKADAVRSRFATLKTSSVSVGASGRRSPSPPQSSGLVSHEARVSCEVEVHVNSTAADSSSSAVDGDSSELSTKTSEKSVVEANSDDDWEAAADRAPDELLPPQNVVVGDSKSSPKVSKDNVPKRHGRGTFSFRKQGLYSDQQSDESNSYSQKDDSVEDDSEKTNMKNMYGTRHVVVLDGFLPSTTTSDLEKLFVNFKDHEFVVRWINDTVAIAVFRSPSLALEAMKGVNCSFSVRILEDDDAAFSSISARDLEPPCRRPQTSARTAQRMIAQSMGLKMPSSFGSRELKKQEEARRNRIVTRQTLIDEAWGPDDVK